MEDPPFIDEHVVHVEAPLEAVWSAVLRTAGASFAVELPQPITSLWGLSETRRTGGWPDSVAVGDTLTGFRVASCQPKQHLSLRGRHRFSRYELRFELEPGRSGAVAVRAKTFALFPGFLGRLYRAIVIGTGFHRVVVRRMLRSVGRQAKVPIRD